MKLDIEIYTEYGRGHWAQARYLVHGYDDVLWTNDIDDAILFMRQSLSDIAKNESGAANEVVILREEANFNIGDGPNDTDAERDEQVRRWMEKNPWCRMSFEYLRFWLGKHWTVEERDAIAANSHSESYSSDESKGGI